MGNRTARLKDGGEREKARARAPERNVGALPSAFHVVWQWRAARRRTASRSSLRTLDTDRLLLRDQNIGLVGWIGFIFLRRMREETRGNAGRSDTY